MTGHEIITGDSRTMQEVGDEAAHLIITSPPYWQLKDYGVKDQIGYDNTYQEYINNLNLVWKECYRVLHPGCRMAINIGDQFARAVYYGRYKVIPIRTEIIKCSEALGFDYMGAIIWQKKTTMNTSGGGKVMGSYPYPRNGIIELDYEFILIFKKPGSPPAVSKDIKEKSRLSKEEWKEYFAGHWTFGGTKQKKHLAMFPEELPRRLIKMFSFQGETILDPFLGSGTTSLAAKNLQRNSIGYEINREFLPIIKEKLGTGKNQLFKEAEIIFREQDIKGICLQEKIEALPYVLQDNMGLDREMDPKERLFGSRVSLSDKQEEKYYSVKKIISSSLLELQGGMVVRLLGIKIREGKEEGARLFLKAKTKGQKVFLRFDEVSEDEEGNLLAYVYLKNRTFINLHMIKEGFASVDEDQQFIQKDKFVKFSSEFEGDF